MCKKTQAGECTAGEQNIQVEGNLTSEDEDEMDSDNDNLSETSSDEGASESDVDSATGNRVTTDMVIWLMLKEQGLISQEKYDEQAKLCEDDIRPLIPKLKKPESEPSENEGEAGEGEDFLKAFLEAMARKREKTIAETTGNNASSSETKETKDVSESGVREDNNVSENKATKNDEVTNVSQEKSQGNIETTPKETCRETDAIELNKEKLQDAVTSQPVMNDIDDEDVEYTIPKCLKCCNISNTEFTTACNSHDENNDVTRENNKNLLNENASEPNGTNENVLQQGAKIEAASTNAEESQTKPENESNPVTSKKTRSFKYILKHIVKEKLISDEYEYVDVLETYVEDLDKQYKNNRAAELFHKPSRELKEFALFLNFYSPSSYKYIVENFNTPLPDHKVLCTWYVKDDERPGLSERAFKILKQKASKKRLTCALMSRDIFMKNFGLDYDQVDYGGGCNFEYTDKAIITYVFILVSLDEDWKIPIGYIFAKRIPPETQAELIRVCLTQCHESGVDVVAVTLDNPTPAEFLGCSVQDVNNLKTKFKHPVCNSEVAIWIDPCLAIRSARHTLKAKGVLYDDRGNKIRWNLIKKLWNLYSDEDIDFEEEKFIELRNHIAKVGLTTEIFSHSLAPALALCEELLPELFRDTAPTRRYIEIVNTLYDILNSKATTNLEDVIHNLDSAKDYMIALFTSRENTLSPYDKENLTNKRLQFRSFMEGKPACGFIAFLICIESFKHLYATLVKEQRLDSLNPHRLCKDHVENFVKNIRAYTRIDPEDFNGGEFQLFYDYFFDIVEEKPKFSDKNVKLEHWTLKNKYSPAVTIKLTSGKRAYDEVYSFQYRPKKHPKTAHIDRATNLVKEYSRALDTETDLWIRKNMVGYIAGWIATKFAKGLKCETCIDFMCTDKKQWFHKFITSRKLKGVCLPSEEIFRICWECERALRFKISPARLRAWVLRHLLQRFPWSSRRENHHPQHHIHLVRAIITKYIPVRVPAPLTTKDRQRVAEMFSVFTCMSKDGFLRDLFQMNANANEDDESQLD